MPQQVEDYNGFRTLDTYLIHTYPGDKQHGIVECRDMTDETHNVVLHKWVHKWQDTLDRRTRNDIQDDRHPQLGD